MDLRLGQPHGHSFKATTQSCHRSTAPGKPRPVAPRGSVAVRASSDDVDDRASMPRVNAPRPITSRIPATAVEGNRELVYSGPLSGFEDEVPQGGKPSAAAPVIEPHPPGFIDKLKQAWKIFFPPSKPELTAREAGKSRLRMILVADRCGLSPASFGRMRESIVSALSEYVEVEDESAVQLNVSEDPEMGTIYSVAIPVKRVRPENRFGLEEDEEGLVHLHWKEDDWDSDPSSRFPFGA